MSSIRFGFLTYGLDRRAFGITRSVLDLGNALLQRTDCEPVFLAPYRHGPFVDRRAVRAYLPGARLLPGFMTLGAVELPWLAHRLRLQLIHDPTGVSPFILGRWAGKFKRVVTLHDATPFRFPETHTWLTRLVTRTYMPMTLRNVDAVITDSQSSKNDLAHFVNVDPEIVHVVPLAIEAQFRPAPPDDIARVVARYQLRQPFVLYLGALEPRKNIPTLIRAFARLRPDFPDSSLVIAGRARWKSAEITDVVEELGLQTHVRRTDYVDADDLPALYSAAEVFCFPSLGEGFGLPVLEAMACGTPVVCSNVSSMPEVAGDAGILVDPTSADAVAHALRRILSDQELTSRLRARGVARAAEFSWKQTAERTVGVYRQVLEKP